MFAPNLFIFCRRILLSAGLFLLIISMARPSRAQTYYNISFPNAEGRLVEVQASFNGPIPAQAEVKMPVWTPGSYLIREFAKNVETLSAYNSQGALLPSRKTDKATWQVDAGGKPFSVRYRVYGNELSVRTPYVAPDMALLPPAAVMVYMPNLMSAPHFVAFDVAARPGLQTITTALPFDADAKAYKAANYDELVDSPFMLGSHAEQSFDQDGCHYRLANYPADQRFSAEQIGSIVKVVAQANRVFGGKPPVAEFTFINIYANGMGGGLEHFNSTVIGGAPGTVNNPKEFEEYLQNVAHEYFHLWNVKRIRPRRLGPFDYQAENYTTTLWFAEGFTSYYEPLLVARAGFIAPDEYINRLAAKLSNAASVAGAQVQSLEQASFDAWIKYYRPNENSFNATVSYYNNGSALGFAVDMRIRALSKGRHSLDDLMRLLWLRTQADPGFYADREAITRALSEVCGSDQAAWLEPLIETPAVPDFAAAAHACGLDFVDEAAAKFYPSIGAGLSKTPVGVMVQNVRRGGPAEKAGVMYQDVLADIDGAPLTDVPDFDNLPYVQGQKLAVDVLRQGKPVRLSITVENSARKRFKMHLPKKDVKELVGWIR